MFDPVVAPLVGRNAIARRGQYEILLLTLVGPERAALGTEGAGATGDRLRPRRDGELGGAAVAASLYGHRPCLPPCLHRGPNDPPVPQCGNAPPRHRFPRFQARIGGISALPLRGPPIGLET